MNRTERGQSLSRPFRLGVWCDYGRTLTPSEGIGVFVHNLVAGLLELEGPIELVLLTHAREQHVVEYLRQRAPDRLQVLPDPRWRPHFRLNLDYFLYLWIVGRSTVAERVQWVRSQGERRIAAARTQVLVLARSSFHTSVFAFLGLGVVGALLVLVCWPMFATWTLLKALIRATIFPLRVFDGVVSQAASHPRFSNWCASTEVAREANCDLWIIPYVGHEYPLDFPAVVFIHDLVIAHYPEHFNAHFVARLTSIVEKRAREAVFCCCMSDFIRENDLLGVLNLSPERAKMIPAAPPGDFPLISNEDVSRLLPGELRRPYLFYPAAFRGYKNHRGLIETLRYLRDERGEEGFDVVFTGAATPFPSDLATLVQRYGLCERVHVLGRVSREVLAVLYQRAFATIVPSLYEQGSFPVHEALHWNCPAACSDIPSLREQCAPLGDAMVYFDPNDPASIAAAVLRIRDGREAIRDEQHQRSRAGAARTWKHVAEEWLPIFREAAELARGRRPRAAA